MTQDRWSQAQRLEAWAGETRLNLIRAIALVVFYADHLLNVYVWRDPGTREGAFHAQVTALVLAWAAGTFLVHACLSRRYMPPAFPFVVTFGDLAFITALLAVSPEGPRSPLVFLYFLVVAAAPLRLSLPLVWAATLGAMAAAAVMMGYYVFFRVGREAYYRDGSPYQVARVSQAIFLLAVGAAGILAGQVVRQARRLVYGYPVTAEGPREAA
jgi:hypothetical protein